MTTLIIEATREQFKETDEKINALIDAQLRTDEQITRTDESVRNLAETVDRHLKEGRNGKNN